MPFVLLAQLGDRLLDAGESPFVLLAQPGERLLDAGESPLVLRAEFRERPLVLRAEIGEAPFVLFAQPGDRLLDAGEALFVLLAQPGDRLLNVREAPFVFDPQVDEFGFEFPVALLVAPLRLVNALPEVGDFGFDFGEALLVAPLRLIDGREDPALMPLLVLGELGVQQFRSAVLQPIPRRDHLDQHIGEPLFAAVADQALTVVGGSGGHAPNLIRRPCQCGGVPASAHGTAALPAPSPSPRIP